MLATSAPAKPAKPSKGNLKKVVPPKRGKRVPYGHRVVDVVEERLVGDRRALGVQEIQRVEALVFAMVPLDQRERDGVELRDFANTCYSVFSD